MEVPWVWYAYKAAVEIACADLERAAEGRMDRKSLNELQQLLEVKVKLEVWPPSTSVVF